MERRQKKTCHPPHHEKALCPSCATNELESEPADISVEENVHGYQQPTMQHNSGDKQPPRFRMTPLKNCERKEKRGQAERRSRSDAGCEQQSWMRSRQDKLLSDRSASGGWLTPPNQCTLRDGADRTSPADLRLSRQDCRGCPILSRSVRKGGSRHHHTGIGIASNPMPTRICVRGIPPLQKRKGGAPGRMVFSIVP